MKRAKKSLSVFLAIVIAISSFVIPTVAAQGVGTSVDIILNGEIVQPTDQEPFINPATGRTMIPLRFIGEAFGYMVEWHDATHTVTIDDDLVHVIGTNTILRTSTGETLTFDAPSFIVAETGRTVVPLRFIAEALNATVNWDDATRSVVIWQEGFAPPSGVPSIIVTQTYLPPGVVNDPRINMTYVAVPSEGAFVTEVSYRIYNSDGLFRKSDFVYLAGFNGVTPMGTLGEATILLFPDEYNHIVFIMRDSLGGEAEYRMSDVWIWDDTWQGTGPSWEEIRSRSVSLEPYMRHWWFVPNWIDVSPPLNITRQQVEIVAASVNGVLLDGPREYQRFIIQLPLSEMREGYTIDELIERRTLLWEISEWLREEYPDLDLRVSPFTWWDEIIVPGSAGNYTEPLSLLCSQIL
jgi:hypothetical protein